MKNNWRSFVSLSIALFFAYVLASLITLAIAFVIVFVTEIDFGRAGFFIFLAILLLSCTILAFILTAIRMRASSKAMAQIMDCLNKMAGGDFSSEININTRFDYLNEIADNLNVVVRELNSTVILKQDFIKNFSHEFKTPIASVHGFSGILKNDKTLSEEQREKYVNIIYDESERLYNLADKTLLLSNLEAQNITLDKEEFFIDEQIEECAIQLYEEAEKKNLDVNIDVSHFSCNASKTLLKELWLNLFSNAIKYTDENGHIKIYSYETETTFAVCFQDDGIGIGDEAKKHIFDEYYQEDSSHVGKGIGLGLSICKRITDMHGWDLTAVSQKGQGSIFTVFIKK